MTVVGKEFIKVMKVGGGLADHCRALSTFVKDLALESHEG